MHTIEQLKQDLTALGVQPGDTILMHSSYKSLGGIEGGAEGFFRAFMDVLGPEGTLILPALSFHCVSADQPVFDARQTPGCIGYLAEYFRTQVPGVVRSLHPTHSCCLLGRRAAEMAAGHELDETPVGPNSPFSRLPKVGGKILMLGCGTNCNTSMHGVEETAEPPYLLDHSRRVDFELHDGDRVVRRSMLCHDFHIDGVYAYRQQYSRVVPLLAENEVSQGKVLDADCTLMSASAVWEKGHNKLLEDPFYFVDKII